MPSDLTISYLNRKWTRSLALMRIDPQRKIDLFNIICEKYSEESRKYHNLDHLYTCFKELDRRFIYFDTPQQVVIGLFWHDFVYDPKSKTNEDDSFEQFKQIMGSHFNNNQLRGVQMVINATKHAPGATYITSNETLAKDADLTSLGFSSEIFDKNWELIRQEYSFVDTETYNRERIRILQNFARERIFLTPFFYARYEAQARKNIARWVEKIKGEQVGKS